ALREEPERRLCCLVLADPRSVALGSEPVRVEGELVGRVTSGGYGYSVGRSIAYAYLPAGRAVAGRPVGVEIFGEGVAGGVAAAELGIGPEVVAYVEPEGYLVTRYVEGEVGRARLEEVARLLRRFHGGRPIAGRFDSFRAVEAYAELAREYGGAVPGGYAAAS